MTTTTVTDLAADSNHELGVRAVDAAGNGTVTVVAATDGEGTDGGGHRGVVPSRERCRSATDARHHSIDHGERYQATPTTDTEP